MASWFYYDTLGIKHGPIDSASLKKLAANGKITPETKVETSEGKQGHAGNVSGLTFSAKQETSPIAEKGQQPAAVNTKGECLTGCGCLLILMCLVGFVVKSCAWTKPERGKPEIKKHVSSPSTENWYEGGTLHGATVKEWNAAPYQNRLATAADWVATCIQRDGKQPKTMDELELMSIRMVSELSRATENLPAEAQGQKVADIAIMTWESIRSEYKDSLR